MRYVFFGALLFAAYKIGEQKAKILGLKYKLSREFNSNGVSYIEFIKVLSSGTIGFTQDSTEASQFNYTDATGLKQLLERHVPNSVFNLETTSINFVNNGFR
jgi:hypothetical protein